MCPGLLGEWFKKSCRNCNCFQSIDEIFGLICAWCHAQEVKRRCQQYIVLLHILQLYVNTRIDMPRIMRDGITYFKIRHSSVDTERLLTVFGLSSLFLLAIATTAGEPAKGCKSKPQQRQDFRCVYCQEVPDSIYYVAWLFIMHYLRTWCTARKLLLVPKTRARLSICILSGSSWQYVLCSTTFQYTQCASRKLLLVPMTMAWHSTCILSGKFLVVHTMSHDLRVYTKYCLETFSGVHDNGKACNVRTVRKFLKVHTL